MALSATYRFDDLTDVPHTLTIEWTGNDLYNRKCWRYQLIVNDVVMFSGDDLTTPMHDDLDGAARAALGFLTLRPGDTDADYFDGYTPAQEAWRDEHAETLSMALHQDEDSDLSEYWVPDAYEDDRDRRCGVGDCAGTQRVVPGTEHLDADGSAMAATWCDTGPHEGAAYWTADAATASTCRRCGQPIEQIGGAWVVTGTGTTADGLSYCPPDPDADPAGVHEPSSGGDEPAANGGDRPTSDAEFLADCAHYGAQLRRVADGIHEWVNTLHAMALPTAVLDPLHTTAVAMDAAAADLANTAASFADEFDAARDVAARGLTITGE